MKFKTKKTITRALCTVFLAMILLLIASMSFMSMAEPMVPELPVDTTDVAWAMEYIDFVTLGICLFVGLLIKHCTPLDNRYIPLIVAALGLGIAIWTNIGTGITPTVILSGLISGVASTGFHQVFKQLFSNN